MALYEGEEREEEAACRLCVSSIFLLFSSLPCFPLIYSLAVAPLASILYYVHDLADASHDASERTAVIWRRCLYWRLFKLSRRSGRGRPHDT